MNDNKRCAWCDAILMGNEMRGDVCNDCLSGEAVCEGCGKPLRDHEGACDDGSPYCPNELVPAGRIRVYELYDEATGVTWTEAYAEPYEAQQPAVALPHSDEPKTAA
jgi:hypothetical protein